MKHIIVSFVFLATLPALGADPYWGQSKDLPGRAGYSTVVEAEDYDRGRDYDAFHDLTPDNEGGAYRHDEVDVYKSEKGTTYLGAILPGEWTSYSVRNPEEGNFDIEIRTSSAFEAASVIFEIQGKEHGIPVPYSGDWDSWRQSTLMSIPLPKGLFNIKLKTNTGNFFIDSFRLIRRPK